MANSPEYQKGYRAGGIGAEKKIARLEGELKALQFNVSAQQERIYMKCLAMALENCSGWTIGSKPINDSAGYCTLAKAFMNNSISILNKE